MLKADRVEYILGRLQELYPETPVPLDHRDPYTLLVAVLLSAQGTDERANQVTPELFALACGGSILLIIFLMWFTISRSSTKRSKLLAQEKAAAFAPLSNTPEEKPMSEQPSPLPVD